MAQDFLGSFKAPGIVKIVAFLRFKMILEGGTDR